MNKTKISIERQINERQYQFFCEYTAPLEEVKAILQDMLGYIDGRIEHHKQEAEQAQKEAQAACCQGSCDAAG